MMGVGEPHGVCTTLKDQVNADLPTCWLTTGSNR
jgi:hypothetical protein